MEKSPRSQFVACMGLHPLGPAGCQPWCEDKNAADTPHMVVDLLDRIIY